MEDCSTFTAANLDSNKRFFCGLGRHARSLRPVIIVQRPVRGTFYKARGKKGHYLKACRSSKTRHQSGTACHKEFDAAPSSPVADVPLKALTDTGSSGGYITMSTVKQINWPVIKSGDKILRASKHLTSFIIHCESHTSLTISTHLSRIVIFLFFGRLWSVGDHQYLLLYPLMNPYLSLWELMLLTLILQPLGHRMLLSNRSAVSSLSFRLKIYHYHCAETGFLYVHSFTHQKIQRRRAELSCYTFDVTYRHGKDNRAIDVLSRICCASLWNFPSVQHPQFFVIPVRPECYNLSVRRAYLFTAEEIRCATSWSIVCVELDL